MSVPRICTSVSPFPAAVPTATGLNCRVCSPSFSPVWVVSLTSSFPCSGSLVEFLVVDDLSSASGDGAAKLEMCERRVEYANTLPVISRESTTIDANACAVLFATFIFSSVVYSFREKITPDFQEPPAAWNSRAQIHPHRRNSTFTVAGTIPQTVPDGQGGQDSNFRRPGGRSRRKTTHCRRRGQRRRCSEELGIKDWRGLGVEALGKSAESIEKSERMSPSPTWLLQTLRFRRLVPPESSPVPSFKEN